MGKSLPRKCNSCEKTIKCNFIKHAKRCSTGFTEWTILNRAGDKIPKKDLKRVPNRVLGVKDGQRVGAHADDIDYGARAWNKVRRLNVFGT